MPPAAAAEDGGSTARCAPFACSRGEQQHQRTRQVRSDPAPIASAGFGQSRQQQGCGRPLGRAAGFVGGGIAAAFFASLERCACVDLRTTGDDCDCEAADDGPLLTKTLHDGAARAATAKTKSSTKRTTSSASATGVARKGRRSGGGGGFVGCCENLR